MRSAKIAKHAVILSEQDGTSEGYKEVRHLGQSVTRMLSNALDAFARFDVEAAMKPLKRMLKLTLSTRQHYVN